MQKKEVLVETCDALAKYPEVEMPWCDIWIRFRDGRKVVKYAPMVQGRLHLIQDIEIWQHIIQEDQAKGVTNDPDDVRGKMEEDVKILEAVTRYGFYFDEIINDMPSLYTKKDMINQKDVESILLEFLNTKGFTNIKFKWKIPDTVCWTG